MWKASLKERRRHRELMAKLESMKQEPYLWVPDGYAAGEDPGEDEKYRRAQEAFLKIVQEIDELERKGREGS